MAVSNLVISAYRRCYTVDQLTTALTQALNDRASGVLVTNISFDAGGGSGTPITGDPNEVIEILELALRAEEGQAPANASLASGVNFQTRRSET